MRRNSFGFVLGLLFVFALAFGWMFFGYLQYMLVALLLSVSGASLNLRLKERVFGTFSSGRADFWSASVMTLGFFLFLFVPLLYFISHTIVNLPQVDFKTLLDDIQNLKSYASALPEPLAFLQPVFDEVVVRAGELTMESLNLGSAKAVAAKVSGFVGMLGNVVSEILWILVFYFFFNLYGHRLYREVMRLLPLMKKSKRILYREFSSTIAVVVYGAGFNMFLQGLAFGILMLFIPGYDALYLGVMAGVLSVVPVVGSALVYLPVLGIELFEGNYLQAGIIFLYSWLVMGILIDNILRILFIGKIKKVFGFSYTMNEIMVLFAMMAGITAMGFWGIIIGPAVVSLGLASLDVYKQTINQDKETTCP